MRARLAGIFPIVLLLLSGGAMANPGDVKIPLRADPATLVRYRIETTQSRQAEGQAPVIIGTQTSEVSFRVLSNRDDGFRMSMSYDKVRSKAAQMEAMGMDPDLTDKVGARYERMSIVYLADIFGNPTSLENLEEVRGILLKNMETIRYGFKNSRMPDQGRQAADRMLGNLEQVYRTMDQAQASQMLFEEIKPLFGIGEVELPPGGEIHFDEDTPWALTGTMLKTRGRIRLVRMDASQAVVELHTGFDRDTVKASLAVAMKQMAQKYGGTVPPQLKTALDNLQNYDVTLSQTSTLRLADGWVDTMTMEQQTVTGPERRIKQVTATRLP